MSSQLRTRFLTVVGLALPTRPAMAADASAAARACTQDGVLPFSRIADRRPPHFFMRARSAAPRQDARRICLQGRHPVLPMSILCGGPNASPEEAVALNSSSSRLRRLAVAYQTASPRRLPEPEF